MTETQKKGRDLIIIAFGLVLLHVFLLSAYTWMATGNFPTRSLMSIAVTAFACIKVLSRNEWAKYGAIIWSIFNIGISLYGAIQYKTYFLFFIALVFFFLIATLVFSKAVDDYLDIKIKNT